MPPEAISLKAAPILTAAYTTSILRGPMNRERANKWIIFTAILNSPAKAVLVAPTTMFREHMAVYILDRLPNPAPAILAKSSFF